MRFIALTALLPLMMACATEKKKAITLDGEPSGAEWLSAYDRNLPYDTTTTAPHFRKEFDVRGPIKGARAKVSGVGYFEFYLNGMKVGDHLLDPAVTRYDKRVKYQVFDVLHYLSGGRNAAGGIVGNGFYNVDTESAWNFNRAPWRNCPAFLCQIDIDYASGKTDHIYTDHTWKFTTGPILFDQIRNGEIYDARREIDGWSRTGYDDSGWESAYTGNGPRGILSRQAMPPIRKNDTIPPVSVTEPSPGVFLVDFGQNIAGWAKIRVDEAEGSEIILRYGERIYGNGTLDQEELSRFIFSGETQTTRYISNGEAGQEYEPRFVYFGFQYIQITGLSSPPAAGDIEAYTIHTDFEESGYFECSNPLLNRLHENIKRSFLGNFHSFPEDCPHREKMGWTGDAQLVVQTGLYNFEALSAYRKWLQDHMDEQRPGGDLPGIVPTSGWGYDFGRDPDTRHYGYGPHWEGSCVVIPWQLYRFSGDSLILREFYPMMKKYLDHLEHVARDYLLPFGIDDHKSLLTHTDGDYISSAYFHWLSEIMEKCARVLCRTDDAIHFSQLSNRIAHAFNTKYLNKGRHLYGNGGQTQMALALGCGLVPDEMTGDVLANLLERIDRDRYHFDCGVVGLGKVIDVLREHNRKDVLYRMVNQQGFPSFHDWIEQGATTMWQNWDGSQSRNHIMFGSIGEYFYNGLAGMNPDEKMPGFRKIVLTPQFPEDMSHLRCGYRTPFGWIRTDWRKEGSRLIYELELPDETMTDLTIPFDPSRVAISGTDAVQAKGIQLRESDPGITNTELPPGHYTLQIELI